MNNVHLVYNGNTEDISLEELFPVERRETLGLSGEAELTADKITAEQMRRALADHFDRPLDEFNELVVEHHKNGDSTVRPNATFGVAQT